MTFPKCPRRLPLNAFFLLILCGVPSSLGAQGPLPEAPLPSARTLAFESTAPPVSREHKFWDRKNCALFVLSGALSAADFAVTRANLQSGGRELNPVVRMFGNSTPGLAVNFAGETAGVIGLSYFFHRTGHHRLERLVSMVNIGASAGAVTYDLARK